METFSPVQTDEKPAPVKRYPFKFSTLILVLCVLGLLCSAAGIALTTWQFAGFLQGDLSSVYSWMKYLLLYLTSILLAVMLTAMLLRSQYVITEKQLVMQFGLIKSKYEIGQIYSVHLFRGAHKLAVYFDDFKTKYIVIVVKETWYDDFIRTLISRNERIGFSFSTAEEEENFKKKK